VDNLAFVPLRENDIDNLTILMKRSFDRDAQIHLGKSEGGPPGYDNGGFLRKWGLHPESTAFELFINDTLVGAIILWINKETQENRLGLLFIDDKLQERGIGVRVWDKVEAMYPDTKIWFTETPSYSKRNHHFYVNKLGFHVIRIENPNSDEEGSFILRKRMKE
jgi:hypothetical protein